MSTTKIPDELLSSGVGTGASNLVELDSSGKLPAVDGSNLTGIATDTSVLENNIAMLGFFRASDNAKSKYNLVDQVIDEYTDATGIDAANSTNESLTSGAYTGGAATSSSLSLSASNFSHSGMVLWDAARAAAGQDNSGASSFHTDQSGIGSWVRYDFGAGNEKALESWSWFIGSGVYATWQTQWSNDNITWTNVGSVFGGNPTTQSTGNAWLDGGVIPNSGDHRYWRMYKTNGATGGGYHFGARFDAWGADVIADLTLQSASNTAETIPTTGDIVMLIEDAAGTATINTDIKAYISRDGSAFSSAVTLTDEGTWGTNKRILTAHNVDISGITSGTSMKYKITTHNQSASKETRIHATSLAWA